MDRDENLKRGTHLWDSVVSWLLMLQSDTIVSGWTWVDVQSTLTSMADIYLKVSEGMCSFLHILLFIVCTLSLCVCVFWNERGNSCSAIHLGGIQKYGKSH